MADDGFCVEVDQTAHVAVLRIRGELDLLTAPEVVARCLELARQGLVNLVVDATNITFIDARGVSALIEGRSAFEEKGTFSVVPSPQVQGLFNLLDDEGLFPSFASTEDALSTLHEIQRTEASAS
jgi:anti-anti-sigma factor